LGAVELSALDPLDPEAELEGVAAGLGALEPPPESEPEPLDGEELAGFGATPPPPPPPESPDGLPATSATLRTTTDGADTSSVVAEVAVVAFAGDSSVPSIHTRAAAPRSTDTDPARHIRDSTPAAT